MADEGTECTDAEMNTPAYVRKEEVIEGESSHLLSWDEWLLSPSITSSFLT